MKITRRKYFGPERFTDLKAGDSFSMESVLGGSFKVEYTGKIDAGHLEFVIVNPGWEGIVSLNQNELHAVLYEMVPIYDGPLPVKAGLC